MSRELKRRTILSFTVWIVGLAALMLMWRALNRQPLVNDTPRPFRQVLELNGRLWQAMFNRHRPNRCLPPRPGLKPRVNGDLGLEEDIDLNQWRLQVIADDHQLQTPPLMLTMADIKKLPRTETAAEFRCIEGWSEPWAYAGVKFSDFVKAYHLPAKAYVGLETPDGKYYVSIDYASMMHAQTLLAYEMNGEPLRPENGAPLRLVIPTKYGIKSIKRIGKIFFSDKRPPDYWAEQGYDWFAGL